MVNSAKGLHLLKKAIAQARQAHPEVTSFWQTRSLSRPVPPDALFQLLKQAPAPFFLDSGNGYSELGRYSFLSAFPFLQATAYADRVELFRPDNAQTEVHRTAGRGSMAVLDGLQARYRVAPQAPFPFAGGAVGFFSYDLKDEFERLPQIALDDLGLPLWRLAWYDGIVVYDHREQKYWLTACGMQDDGQCSPNLAKERLDRLEELCRAYPVPEVSPPVAADGLFSPAPSRKTLSPALARDRYLGDLKKVMEYIFAGDIYQANLTQRFTAPWDGDSWALYQRLREGNPAPFAAFLPYPDFQILCSSPERFIRLGVDGRIETCPIKGTRPRGATPAADLALAEELRASAKDRAELTMIIDLERNDLGRICEVGTVAVPDRIRLEKYPTVWHLVSTVTGQVRAGLSPGELLRAVFPGGSISGAPKIRAMEIIEELEPHRRGHYTGSIGYLGFDGAWDLNIVIRTILLKAGRAYVHAGGGIVADSVPDQEYEETLYKARAMFDALEGEMA